MSDDHNMNQESGWRKRQIALDKKAENARELGLDYEPCMNKERLIELAKQAGWEYADDDRGFELLWDFAELVREEAMAEANARANASWTLMCEKMVAIEREAIAQSLDKQADLAADEIDRQWAQEMAAAVRAKGQA